MSTLALPLEQLPAANNVASKTTDFHPKNHTITHVKEINLSDSKSSNSTPSSPAASVRETSETILLDLNLEATSVSTPKDTINPTSPDLKPLSTTSIKPEVDSPLLISSPYLEPSHLLNLSTLDIQSSLLARALTALEPVGPSYATTPYSSSLNWPLVFSRLQSLSEESKHTWTAQVFYVVDFRSKLKEHIDRPLLFDLDKYSHAEANISGGLLKYWYGSPDAERRNLATCLWVSKEHAVAGGKGPWHKKARGVTTKMYESIDVKGVKLTVEDGVKGWSFEPWTE